MAVWFVVGAQIFSSSEKMGSDKPGKLARAALTARIPVVGAPSLTQAAPGPRHGCTVSPTACSDSSASACPTEWSGCAV